MMMEVAIEKMFAVWFSLQMRVDGDVRRWCSGMVEIASWVVSTTTTSTPIGFLDLCISLAVKIQLNLLPAKDDEGVGGFDLDAGDSEGGEGLGGPRNKLNTCEEYPWSTFFVQALALSALSILLSQALAVSALECLLGTFFQ
ncbi:hypothetical protein LR48_Vigan01g197300 [Vigna angularis]|uniref:Uncharacterized protein n=1 Tax=Phaseolus angularis TaxID=3914 RepID=A0A0L9TPM9_PHAAN|nr:hypothetical protein LR48_Vigan01g197300 [Vigna angularis]